MRNLFILRGAPASGKSTWIKENNLEPYTISTDSLRLMYQSPITTKTGEFAISQNHDKEVWGLLMDLLERRMENGELVIIDATHYKSNLINRYKDLVSKYRYRVYVVDFSNVSEEELLRRNEDRGFRKVPDEVIEKMVVALKDDKEIKKAYKVLTPEEATSLIESPLEPFEMPENINKVVIFGDIHGCMDPINEYFEKNPFDENTNYIFTGDYIDRGLQNKEVLEFLISIKDKKNCVFLEGNHEKWLRIYAQKDYDMEYYENKNKEYKDIFVSKLIAQLKDREITLQKTINRNTNKSDELSKLLRESWETNPDNREVYYHFELVNVPETQKELHREINECGYRLEKVKRLICLLQHEEHNTKDLIESTREWFKETFNMDLGMDVTNILEKSFNVTSNRVDNPIRSVEFIKKTYPQIKDMDKTDLRRFCDKLAQMSYFKFNGQTFLVTHGGLPNLPTMKTQTIEMIKGVGKYEDAEVIDETFIANTCGQVCQIHGHRNIMKLPTCIEPTLAYNLEGQVEFGGNLRILELSDCGGDVLNYHITEIKNEVYDIPEVKEEEEKSDLELLKEMHDSRWVQVKNLNDNVISFNFTRDAFEKDKWDTITCHARGLFVDKTNGQVVARSFGKFFNYRQHETTEPQYMKEHIVWPLIGYKKENGFLGIVSKYNGKVRFFTKSSDEGDYVNWFIGVLCDIYGIKDMYSGGTKTTQTTFTRSYTEAYNEINRLEASKKVGIDRSAYSMYDTWDEEIESISKHLEGMREQLKTKLLPLLEEGYSYVFECIDKDNDPHIIKYMDNKVVLLEVFKNQLKEEHVSWKELHEIADKLLVPCKSQELRFNNWEEFEEWKDKFRQGVTQWDCKHEGYVFEDQNNYRVKFKSSFYNFWKQMRAVKDALAGGRQNKKIYKTKEEIQVVKILERHTREELQNMSIIDIDEFYKEYEVVTC